MAAQAEQNAPSNSTTAATQDGSSSSSSVTPAAGGAEEGYSGSTSSNTQQASSQAMQQSNSADKAAPVAIPAPANGSAGTTSPGTATSPPSSRIASSASALRSPRAAAAAQSMTGRTGISALTNDALAAHYAQGPGYEREMRAREMMSDSDTESNLSSRPPSPDRHRFPKHRLSGLQSKDSVMVKLEDAGNAEGAGRLQLARERSPFDLAHAGDGTTTLNLANLCGDLPPTPLTAVPLKQARGQSNGTVAEGARPSSPPPRAMSPSKSAATIKVSQSGFVPGSGVNHSAGTSSAAPPRERGAGDRPNTPATSASESGSLATPVATRPAQPPPTSSKPDGRALFKRMLSGNQSNGSNQASGTASPSSRGSTPPGSPSESTGTTADSSLLAGAIQSMNIGSPPSSQPPSRNVSLRRKDSASVGTTEQQGGRLTAAALRDLDAKGYTASGPGATPAAAAAATAAAKDKKKSTSGKEKDKGDDAKSTASSTLREMIMGSAPKLSRRGSSASGGSKKGASQAGDTASLLKKYGVCEKAAIGKGATAVVRLAHKWDRSTEKLYAVKEFRKRRKNESEKEYVKKLTSEFCISSTLHHINVVETVDLVQDENRHWCEVMEFCPGGDLYAAIKRGDMGQPEIECCFKQTMHGIAYLHSMGVAHRDIKPENLLLDAQGRVKITDFGVSDVFRMCWEKSTHYSKGLCGSEPYIAPEQFEQKEYDARLVDVWAAAVVFYCMQFQELPWRVAKMSDPTFKEFVHSYHSSNAPGPLSSLTPRDCRPLLKKMLCPDPKQRWGTEEILKDAWFDSVSACGTDPATNHKHHIVLTAT